jgi:LytR cell envelope-related transcriptional attenuator
VRRHQRERLAGILVVLVGAVVLVVAIVALRSPKGSVSSGSGKHTTITNTVTPSSGRASSSSGPAPSRTSSARPSTQSSTRTSASTPPSGVKAVPLVVLNNTTTAGLAHTAARRFQAGGWTVTRFANYQNDIASTCAYYDPNSTGAKAAAEALQAEFPTIKRVQPKFAELPNGPVVVVLTPDYTST